MIHLSAFVPNPSNQPIPDHRIQQWKQNCVSASHDNRWIKAGDRYFLLIQGDCSLEHFVYSSDAVDLICYTDLLGSGSGEDFAEANQNPASYLAHRYEKMGEAFARELRGWFGVILYDHKEKRLKAWTDHFGVRRLVYQKTSQGFGMASDLRLLNAFFDRKPEVEPASILEYLQYTCIPAPHTIYKGISRLEPGHWITSDPDSISQPFWGLNYQETKGRNQQAWEESTYQAIESAVARSSKVMDNSQHIGCFLSGGTDSSSVSGLVGKITQASPTTISIGFEDPRYNEIEYARIAAKHFKTDHHEYFVKPADILSLLTRIYDVYDEPFGNSSIVPAFFCSKTGLENGVTHMLAGDGGDELFGGNQRYGSDRLFQRYHWIPRFIRKGALEPLVAGSSRLLKIDKLDLIQRYIRRANIPLPDRYFSYDFISSVNRAELFSNSLLCDLKDIDPLAVARKHFRNAVATEDLNRWLQLDLKITITDNDIRKVTVMAELAGTVPRYPLLDPGLAEFAATIPSALKVKGMQLRYLFKQAMSRILPREILTKTKHGFGLPFSTWLLEDPNLHTFVFDILGSGAARQRGYLRPDMLEWLWTRYQTESKVYYGDVLWTFLMLELWHRSLDRQMSDFNTMGSN